jgi:hypothetical protein
VNATAPPPPEPASEEIRQLRADLLRLAEAAGIYYEADGHNREPGPVDSIEQEILGLRRSKQEAIDEAQRFNAGFDKARAGEPAPKEDEFEEMGWAWFHHPKATPPEPVVRWCLKDPQGKLDTSCTLPTREVAEAHKRSAGPGWVPWSVVRVEIREKPL